MLSILTMFAQYSNDLNNLNYSTNGSTYSQELSTTQSAALFGALMVPMLIIILLSVLPGIIVWWKLFEKAGKPGWASIVPIYNLYVMTEIAEVPVWYMILALLPLVNIIGIILIAIELSKKYSNPATVWLGFLFPIVALFMIGKTQYTGRDPQSASVQNPDQALSQNNPANPTVNQRSTSSEDEGSGNNTQPPAGPLVQ